MAESIAKQNFLDIYNKYIKREGAEALLQYLNVSDFFTAPASTRFHMAEREGLAKHSVNVYRKMLSLIKMEYGDNYTEKISDESIAVTALLHDVCKTETYVQDFRNVKVNGAWEQQPYYTVDEKLPYGHGEKSVYIINGYLRLSREEALAINWHMGGFDERTRGGTYTIGQAFAKYPLAVFLHSADFLATYLDEKIER